MILTLALKPWAAFACVAEWTNLGLKLHWSSANWDGCHSLSMEIAYHGHLSTLIMPIKTTKDPLNVLSNNKPKENFSST
jgi:hypothetical protein